VRARTRQKLPAEFRVGINLGDVIAEEHDIFGDGVNVAARLEALAEPGGVFVSNTVHDHVRDRLPFGFEDLGDQQVKNIARPVRVYRVLDRAVPIPEPLPASPQPLPLPDEPSIAVLPFTNMSPDPEQELFADGIAEDIFTALSRYPSLFVIARNSSFTYKGRPVIVAVVQTGSSTRRSPRGINRSVLSDEPAIAPPSGRTSMSANTVAANHLFMFASVGPYRQNKPVDASRLLCLGAAF
jgi:hypothetical protein